MGVMMAGFLKFMKDYDDFANARVAISKTDSPYRDIRSPYKILGIHLNTSQEDIKKAYRSQSVKLHPDRNIDRIDIAAMEFKLLSAAYRCLNDEENGQFLRSEQALITTTPAPTDPSKSIVAQRFTPMQDYRDDLASDRIAALNALKTVVNAATTITLGIRISFCKMLDTMSNDSRLTLDGALKQNVLAAKGIEAIKVHCKAQYETLNRAEAAIKALPPRAIPPIPAPTAPGSSHSTAPSYSGAATSRPDYTSSHGMGPSSAPGPSYTPAAKSSDSLLSAARRQEYYFPFKLKREDKGGQNVPHEGASVARLKEIVGKATEITDDNVMPADINAFCQEAKERMDHIPPKTTDADKLFNELQPTTSWMLEKLENMWASRETRTAAEKPAVTQFVMAMVNDLGGMRVGFDVRNEANLKDRLDDLKKAWAPPPTKTETMKRFFGFS